MVPAFPRLSRRSSDQDNGMNSVLRSRFDKRGENFATRGEIFDTTVQGFSDWLPVSDGLFSTESRDINFFLSIGINNAFGLDRAD